VIDIRENFRFLRIVNHLAAQFILKKIRQVIDDPEKAKVLTNIDHPYAAKRPPIDTNYFETFNRDNVALVDVRANPIERITPDGIQLRDGTIHRLDIIVFATGFDAITGSLDRIDIRGVGGRKLKERWKGGLETFMGVMIDGFPNLFMVMGPHTALGNIPRSIEYNVEWIRDLLAYLERRRLRVADARRDAVEEWTAFVKKKGEGLLANEVDSWMTGVNMNVEGKNVRIIARYSGTAPEYREWGDRVAADGYRELAMRA